MDGWLPGFEPDATSEETGILPLEELRTLIVPDGHGVLPSQGILGLMRGGHIQATLPIDEQQIQPASLDLRLGNEAHRLQASFLPGSGSRVASTLADLSMTKLDLSSPTLLEKGCVYLVKLMEELRLPDELSAKANPKSTTGRLDIFTRLITDYGGAFEHVQPGYTGPLYAEIMPRTFSVVVRQGLSLSQIRFIRGDPRQTEAQLRKLDREERLVYLDAVSPGKAEVRDGGVEISVSLDLGSDVEACAYRGKRNTPLVDLEGRYEPAQFWDMIRDCPQDRLILDPGDFYVLASREKVRVPCGYAAEMVPFDPSVGEFRIHYAGFFDPGFGYGDGSITGTRAVLEVRAHETPFMIEDGQVVGRLIYSRMLDVPQKIYGTSIGSSYQQQELALSKQFRRSPAHPSPGQGRP